jgi:hypothetical protein
LVFALTGLADRYAASRIFAICSVLGAAFNAAFALASTDLPTRHGLPLMRRSHPGGHLLLGMKLIVSWDPQRAEQSLGLLVGMLCLGTALPHGIRMVGGGVSWQAVMLTSSALALIGAALVWTLGDGRSTGRVVTGWTSPLS